MRVKCFYDSLHYVNFLFYFALYDFSFKFYFVAITSSAKKAIRVSARKRVFNLRRKNAIADVVKKIKRLLKEKKNKEAQAFLPTAYQAIDKAAKTKYLKKNTAARKKSRLAKLLNRQLTTNK